MVWTQAAVPSKTSTYQHGMPRFFTSSTTGFQQSMPHTSSEASRFTASP